jgi:hypothetical protein
MHTAGIVSNHSTQSAAIMRRGVGREGEMVFFGGGTEVVEYHSRLHAGKAAGGIDFKNPRHVLGKIENDGDIAALSGEGCAAAATKQRRTELAAECNSSENILGIAREHDANRDLAIV